MSLPFFYEAHLTNTSTHFTLGEETSKHCVQVLRMKNGEKLRLTNGKGLLCTASITSEDKRKAVVTIETSANIPAPAKKTGIAISLLKNTSRFEWFLEKATEIGVTHIRPMVCARTEHTRFKTERMQGILISAMLQSQQVWLPEMAEPLRFEQCLAENNAGQKLIAHCEEKEKKNIGDLPPSNDTWILIGPEGDFTSDEIELALSKGYIPVSLGDTRLRAETAGMVAAALLVSR